MSHYLHRLVMQAAGRTDPGTVVPAARSVTTWEGLAGRTGLGAGPPSVPGAVPEHAMWPLGPDGDGGAPARPLAEGGLPAWPLADGALPAWPLADEGSPAGP